MTMNRMAIGMEITTAAAAKRAYQFWMYSFYSMSHRPRATV